MIRQYTAKLSNQELEEIRRSYEVYEAQGFIGQSALRQYTERYMQENKISSNYITRFFDMLAMDVYRELLMRCEKVNIEASGMQLKRGELCFACGRYTHNPKLVDTRDGQLVFVGPDCYIAVQSAGPAGYQPPSGGPRLWLQSSEVALSALQAPAGYVSLPLGLGVAEDAFRKAYATFKSLPDVARDSPELKLGEISLGNFAALYLGQNPEDVTLRERELMIAKMIHELGPDGVRFPP